MKAVRLNDRITLGTKQRVPDGGGGSETTWVDTEPVWASLKPLGGSEQATAEQQRGVVRYKVMIRRRSIADGVNSGMRLTWVSNGGVVMNVREVLDSGPRFEYLVFHAESGQGV